MSDRLTWWKHRTKTGRVVYEREKHPFTWRDVLRIINQLEAPEKDEKEYQNFLWAVILILEMWAPESPNPAETSQNCLEVAISTATTAFPGFGGGGFGGGGSSGDFATRRPGESPFAFGPCGKRWIVMPIQPC